jgi:hypothetical protein
MTRTAVRPVLVRAAHEVGDGWIRSIPHDWPGQNNTITGNTARDIRVEFPAQMRASISTGTISGKSLERGAREHEIHPRGPWPLRWPPERGGWSGLDDDPDAERVRWVAVHPGVQPRYYGWRMLNRVKAGLLGRLEAAMARIP